MLSKLVYVISIFLQSYLHNDIFFFFFLMIRPPPRSPLFPSTPLSRSGPCTRLVYLGANGQVVTARSMDWKSDIVSNLWVLPRGMERSGKAGPNSLRWTSRYGSVVTSGYDVSTTDGVNEAGLNANLLWLVGSQYPARSEEHTSELPSPCNLACRL